MGGAISVVRTNRHRTGFDGNYYASAGNRLLIISTAVSTHSGSDAIWRRGLPAHADALATLRRLFPGVPETYLSFLAAEDGSEGDLGVAPGWISFWPAAAVAQQNSLHGLALFLPGFVGFASTGDGELFAFDSRGTSWRICIVPFFPMDESNVVEIVPDFDFLARAFGRTVPAG